MDSSKKRKRIHDVFLSFRGTDVRNNFLSHLYKALVHNGIDTFQDREKLEKGDQILPVLMKAIEQSRIAIIIFSENYASSKWCLEEVVKIMECKEQTDLIVLPVFHKVDPNEVRGGRKSYERALAKHESKFGKDSEEVRKWKKALFDAGSLSGWHFNDGDESELIQSIVEKISAFVDRVPLHLAKHPVGIKSRVIKLKLMLNADANDDVVMMGLWGLGGIGKTTLAKALYNATIRQFEGSCFLANVRETSKGHMGLVTLQKQLLKDILSPQQRLEVSNVDEGINIIQHRLCHKKVLLVLDDVDDLCQLNALVGECKWFGNGSRIIVTTRDKHLLTVHRINQDHVCEVKELDNSEALELLSKHAFLTHSKLEIRTDLVDGILKHAQGLPLALEVLGSFLCGRREPEWESTLKKLSGVPNSKINDVLRISYDALEENEKEIFLDIACFFKGRKSEYVKKVLNSCDLEAEIGLKILMEKTLISNEWPILQMHDLIQSMGKDIVRQGCHDDPWRHSRLWRYDDVAVVLSSDMGDCAVKAIVLEPPELKELSIHSNAFMKMRKLRLLILRNVRNSFHDPICLPNELRWMECTGCDPWNPKFSSGPKKLVSLVMWKGNITGFVQHFKDFQQLRYITLSDCESLISTPNLSCTPNLEELKLWNCKNLIEAHESIAYHDKLQVLHFKWCPELHVFPNVLKSKNLQDLNLSVCPKFERFPDIPHILEGLKELSILHTAIKELPASIENLISLEVMLLDICKNPVSIPPNIYKLRKLELLRSSFRPIVFPKLQDSVDPCMKIGLPNLKTLYLEECHLTEVEFLEDLSCFPLLESLNLGGNNITSLPTSISKRDRLFELYLYRCHQLQEIPELPPYLKRVTMCGCKSLQTNGHLTSIDQWVRRGLTMVDTASLDKDSSCEILLPGREMPKWFQPVEEGSIFFMASKDLYDKFLGLVFCAVRNNKGHSCSFNFEAHFNGKSQGVYISTDFLLQPGNIWLKYFPPSNLGKEVHFGQIDGSYAQFSLKLSRNGVKKWGFRIICKQLDDDLKVALRDSKLIDLAFLYEVGHDSIDPEAESSHMQKDDQIGIGLLKNLQKSSRMHKNRQVEFDLDGPSSYDDFGVDFGRSDGITYVNCGPDDPYVNCWPDETNKKLKVYLEELEE